MRFSSIFFLTLLKEERPYKIDIPYLDYMEFLSSITPLFPSLGIE